MDAVKYTAEDIARSLQRYYSTMLGDNAEGRWQWRLQREEVADDKRPVAVLELGVERSTQARNAIDQGNVIVAMPFTVTLYPPIAEPRPAGQLARQLSSWLLDAVAIGIDLGTYTRLGRKRPVAGPMRLPLWDYAGVPLTGAGRAGPAAPADHLWVEDVTARPIQDPQDARRWTVASDVRVSWEKPGRVAPAVPIAARFLPTGKLLP